MRLVKGAYWDHEIVEAAQHGWNAPVFEVKADSDRNFERADAPAARRRRGCGRARSPRTTCARSPTRSPTTSSPAATAGDLELQVLRGLGDPLQHAIAAQGLRVRTYCPVGDLVAGMAYLVRRLLENTSNESFLADQAKGVPIEELLAAPRPCRRSPTSRSSSCAVRPCARGSPARWPRTTPGPLACPVWIGEDTRAGDALVSTDPGAPDRVVARAAAATEADVDAALAPAAEHRDWGRRRPRSAPRCCSRAAAWLREHRLAVAALEVRECAKPWPEADADVCEAIDFLEYYARGAIELEAGAELLQLPGERNTLRYAPRGVVAVIAPWNFPVAIPCGMVAAGLATGNAVVLKPAEQAPGCAYVLVRALREAGVPAGRSRCCPARATSAPRWSRPARAHDRVHRLLRGRAGDRADRRPIRPTASATSSA